MNINFREIKSKNVWENFISKQKHSSIFQSWNWGEFELEMGNEFERVGIFRVDELVGLLPLKCIKAVRGRYLHLRHGPIFNFGKKGLWDVMVSFLKEKAKKKKCLFVRMSPLIKKSKYPDFKGKFRGFRKSSMHDVDAEITWVLNLEKSEDEILKQMRKNTRYYIGKAKRDGVKIFRTKDAKYIKDFWGIYKETFERQSWHAYTKKYIKKEFEILSKDDQIELYLAKYKGEYIAGSLIIYYNDQAIYHHGGTLEKYLKIPASYLIQWEAIKEAQKRGLKWYNFWGISPLVESKGEFHAKKGHPWEGLTFFKMGFGGEVREFIHARDLPVSPIYHLTRVYESIEKWRRGY